MRIKENVYEILTNVGLIRNRKHVLRDIINVNKFESFVEVGVLHGNTSAYLLRHCPTLKKVFLVDPYNHGFSQSGEGFANATLETDSQHKMDLTFKKVQCRFKGDKRVWIIRRDSHSAINLFVDYVDLVFLDDNHCYPFIKRGIRDWWPLVRKGGMLSGHDYDTTHPGVMLAVNERFKADFTCGTDTVWYKRK